MSNRSGQRSTGAVSRVPGSYRTLTGGCFHPQRNQCIELPRLLPEDLKVLQAATKPLQLLFPHLEWEEWGVELVEGHDRLVEILPQEKTIIIDRHGQGELALLSWDLFGAFFHMILTTEYDHWLPAEEAQQYAFVAQLRWFLQESPDWQYEIIASLALPGMDTLDLAGLLWSILPETRSSKLEILLRDQALPRPRWSALDPQEACWHAAVDYLERQTSQPMSTPQAHPSATPVPETMAPVPPARLDKLRHALSVCSLLSWDALASIIPGLLVRYFHEIDPNANSTTRRLGLFRICVEQQLSHETLQLMPHNWPLLSLVVLDPDRHPKIHRALVQFQDLLAERDQMALWSIKPDEALLVQLTLRNQLSEQDDRFFRQATHIQAIWRDILHRNASQPWASQMLFDALEKLISTIQEDPDLFFAAVIWNRNMWEASQNPIAPELQNLRELLWILSHAPLPVLRRLYPQDEEDSTQAHENWPLLRNHIRRFLNLAPPILLRLLEQVEEELGRTVKNNDQTLSHIDLDPDPDIPQQDLRGRILPLLTRPEMLQHRWVNLEQTTSLRIIHLDRCLPESSGKIREQRFFSSFLFFFKTEQDQQEGGWTELALWIDKDLDLSKLINKKAHSPTIRGLLLEDGIWERTYRYQFLTMDQLLKKLKPELTEWRSLLRLLAEEYRPLLQQRVVELLDYQFYLTRNEHLGARALTGQLDDPALHPFLRLSIDDYESTKLNLAQRIVDHALQAFEAMQSQDDRNWQHAHQTIAHTVRQLTLLLHLPPGGLFAPPKEAHNCRLWSWKALQEWEEHPDEIEPSPIDPALWVAHKVNLLKRLERIHPGGALKFVHFLLEQVNPDVRVVRRFVDSPQQEGKRQIFKPIPTDQSNASAKELTPYLRDAQAQLSSPAFLDVLAQLPKNMLLDAMNRRPELFPSLQKAAELLREVNPNAERTLQFQEIVEELRPIYKSSQENIPAQEKVPTPEGGDLQEQSH